MTKYKSIFVVLIFLFSFNLVFGATTEKEFKKIIDFREGGRVYLKNVNGNIDVKSWGREEVEVIANIKVKAGSMDDAEDFLEKVEINVDKSIDEIEIEVDYPKREGKGFWDIFFGWGKPSVSISFLLNVPKITNLDMNTTNGKVKVYDIEGKVYSNSTNGSINVEKVIGDAELKTTNGSILASNVKGDINAKTTNGKVNLKGIIGNVSAKSTNGEIHSQIIEIDVAIEMNFKTTNGSIEVSLPSGIDADLDASTTNGKISSEFPVVVQGEINKRHITGKINNGGPLIYIRTTNGSIKVSESEKSEHL
ncbi:MAG: DUF4097 family beta strand repeat protein [Candidatus Helarchaeota archaeon]|nr:DUF4097 family beta strand repeat protein [Candidatus Helarchaeota archaeon]